MAGSLARAKVLNDAKSRTPRPEPAETSGRSKRKASNPHAVGVDHHHRSSIEIGYDRLQIGVQQCCQLSCTTLALPTEQHERRRRSVRPSKQLPEISVTRHHHPVVVASGGHDLGVRSTAHPELANVDRVVTQASEKLNEQRRQILIEQESHAG